MNDSKRSSRASTVVVAGMVVFAAAFVGLATWLGQRDRASYRLEPLPPLAPEAQRLADALDTWRPLWPKPSPESSTNGDALRADLESFSLDEALDRAREAIEVSPGNATRYNLALVLALRREDREAWRALHQDPTLALHYGEAAFLAALLLERSGEDADAETAWSRAAALLEDDPEPLYRQARLLARSGRLRDAQKAVEHAVRLEPSWPEAQFLLGELMLATQDLARAKRAFQDVLQLQPDHERAKAHVRRLDGS